MAVPPFEIMGRAFASGRDLYYVIVPVTAAFILITQNLTTSRFGRALTAIRQSETAAEAGERPRPAPLPRATGQARFRDLGFTKKLTREDLPSADLFDRLQADTHEALVYAREANFLRDSLRTGRRLAKGDKLAAGEARYRLGFRDADTALKNGMLTQEELGEAIAGKRDIYIALPEKVASALSRFHEGRAATDASLGTFDRVINTLARVSVSIDPGGVGMTFQMLKRLPASSRMGIAGALIVRNYLRAVVNKGLPPGRIPASVREWARMTPEEYRALFEARRAGVEIAGRPVEMTDTGFRLLDAYLRVGDRILWAPEGFRQLMIADLERALTRPTMLRRAVESVAGGRAGAVAERITGARTFDPRDPRQARDPAIESGPRRATRGEACQGEAARVTLESTRHMTRAAEGGSRWGESARV